MKTLSIHQTLSLLCRKLEKKKKVFYTRFGDNDIMMMSGTDLRDRPLLDRPYGGNRTVFSEELQMDLTWSFSIDHEDYLIGLSSEWDNEPGMKPGLFQKFKYNDKLQEKVKTLTDKRDFCIPVLFQYMIAFCPEGLDLFIDKYLKGKKILFIGSSDRLSIETILGKVDYVVRTPEKGSYDHIDSWYKDVEAVIKGNDVDVVIPACGQASRVLAGRLWGIEKDFHLIDMGSIFDVFKNESTRTWIKMVGNEIRSYYNHDQNGDWTPTVQRPKNLRDQLRDKYNFDKQKNEMLKLIGTGSRQYRIGILIPSMYKRRKQLRKLRAELQKQIIETGNEMNVKVFTFSDGGIIPIGAKRNSLVIKAAQKCKYLVSFDDDDSPEPTYIEDIVEASYRNPDCITFKCKVHHNDGNETYIRYHKDNRYQSVEDRRRTGGDCVVEKSPGHLCPIKTDILLRFPTPVKWGKQGSKNRKERDDNASDVHHLMDMYNAGVFKKAIHIDKFLYNYNYDEDKDKETQDQVPQ